MLGLQLPLEPKIHECIYMDTMIKQYAVLLPTEPPPGTIHTIYIYICIYVYIYTVS